MNRIHQYYERELSTLREQGKLFADRFPKLAPFLGQASKDPDIERLLEGFAFIGAKLQAKIEDAYPELAEQFLEILAPGYFCITPSATVLQFKPNASMAKQGVFLPRGTEILGTNGIEDFCLSSCYDLSIEPLEISAFNKTVKQGLAHIKLKFQILFENTSHDIRSNLRFYLQGDLREVYALSYILKKKLKKIYFETAQAKFEINQAVFKCLGFEPTESLIPYFEEHHQSFTLLKEYFNFPEKFMFMELEGLCLQEFPPVKEFELTLVLELDERQPLSIRHDHFQLNAVPCINIFKAQAEPVTHAGTKIRYPLRTQALKNSAVHSVRHVKSFIEPEKAQIDYIAARQFTVMHEEINRYQTRLNELPGQDHPNVSLEVWSSKYFLDLQTLSIDILAYQPEAFLKINGKNLLSGKKYNLGVAFTNLIPFTMPVYPPLSIEVIWRLIAYLAFKFKNLTESETLRQLVLAHDFSSFVQGEGAGLGKKVSESIRALHTETKKYFYRGEIFYGKASECTITEDGFLNMGEIELFGSILAKILQDHAPFNSFHELTIKGALTGSVLSWPAQF